jgi:hypothetical protein
VPENQPARLDDGSREFSPATGVAMAKWQGILAIYNAEAGRVCVESSEGDRVTHADPLGGCPEGFMPVDHPVTRRFPVDSPDPTLPPVIPQPFPAPWGAPVPAPIPVDPFPVPVFAVHAAVQAAHRPAPRPKVTGAVDSAASVTSWERSTGDRDAAPAVAVGATSAATNELEDDENRRRAQQS